MSRFFRCDGCGDEVVAPTPLAEGKKLVVRGERVGSLSGGGLPLDAGRAFHWCLDCARVAFAALANRGAS